MVILILLSGIFVYAQQPWRSILYPEDWVSGYTLPDGRFLHDFSYAGYHSGEKQIPFIEKNVYDVTQPPFNADNSGNADVTAILQKALDDLGKTGGGVVYLPAGTYRIKPVNNFALRMSYNNVVLRGAGKDKTFLLNDENSMRSKDIILVRPLQGGDWTKAEVATAAITSDLERPVNIIPVSSVTPFKVGDRVIITSDVTSHFIEEHGMQQLWTTSGMIGPTFYRIIKNIDTENKTIQLDTPTRYPLKMRDNARVYVVNSHLSEVGIENLSIGNRQNILQGWGEEDYSKAATGAYEVHSSHAIRIFYTMNSWIKNVATYKPSMNTGDFHLLSNGILLYRTRFITVTGCDFRKPQYEGGGGNGYMFILQGNDCLIENSLAVHSRHNYDFKTMAANGNVILRCTGKDSYLSSDFHMHLSMANLFDNFTVDKDYLEAKFRPYGSGNLHGHPTTQSVFWNTKGLAYHEKKQFIIDSKQFGWGYIVGTSGPAFKVSTTPISGTQGGYAYNSAPEDHTEGIGMGETLLPQSLYKDQLAGRLLMSETREFVKMPGLNMEVYPNPVEDYLRFRGNDTADRVAIFDLTGTLLLAFNGISGKEISLHELPDGLFLIRITGHSGIIHTSKLVKISHPK
jgi:hypothetical protein